MDSDALADEFWVNADLELIARVDTVVLMEGWETSVGARSEREHAIELNKEIIYDETNAGTA